MPKYSAFIEWISRLEKFMQIVAQMFVFVLMIITVANIVGRFFGYPVVGIIEASIILLVFILYLGLPYTQSQRGHVRVEMVVNLLPSRKREVVDIIALFIALAILSFMFWQTAVEGIRAFIVKTYQPGLISFPTWPGKLVIPLGLFFFTVRVIIQIAIQLYHLRTTPNFKNKLSEAET